MGITEQSKTLTICIFFHFDIFSSILSRIQHRDDGRRDAEGASLAPTGKLL